MQRLSLISRLRVQKLLWRTMLLLLVFSLITAGATYALIHGQLAQRYQQEGIRRTRSILQQTGAELEGKLRDLETQAGRVWQNDGVSSLLVSPEGPDLSRAAEAALFLERLQAENPLVQRCYLYLDQSGQLLTVRQQLLSPEDPDAPEDLADLLQRAQRGERLTVCEAGRLYLLLSFPEPKRLGLLILQLDTGACFQQIQAGAAGLSGGPVYVYTRQQEPLFANRLRYPQAEQLQVSEKPVDQGAYALIQGSGILCAVRLDYSGWYYLAYLSDALPSGGEVLTAFLPAALVLLMMIVLLSLLILHTVYQPIQKIVKSLVQGGNPEGRDEAQLIQEALTSNREENRRLEQLLSQVNPALEQRLLSALLAGGPEEEIQGLLSALQNPLPEGTYLVLACAAVPEQSASAVEQEIYLRSLEQWVSQFWQERCPIQAQVLLEQSVAVILSPAPSELAVEEFRRAMEQRAGELPFTPVTGAGLPRAGRMRLCDGWREARQNLNYQKYRLTESRHREDQEERAGFYENQVSCVVELALSGELPQARALVENLRQPAQEAGQEEQLRTMLHSRFLSKTLQVQRELGERWSTQSTPASPRFWEELDGLLLQLEEWGRNSQRTHVDRAIDYIAAHFADSSLSLNQVSDHVGLNVSYLSTLFAKYQPPGFSHYLRQYRIEQARLLLESTGDSVAEIGYRTGFNSSNSFIRAFKSLVGETPGKYRDSRRIG